MGSDRTDIVKNGLFTTVFDTGGFVNELTIEFYDYELQRTNKTNTFRAGKPLSILYTTNNKNKQPIRAVKKNEFLREKIRLVDTISNKKKITIKALTRIMR